MLLCSLLCLALVSEPPQVPFALPALPTSNSRLLTDQQSDGTVWVRGENYKLALGTQGARFIPRERQAQRNHRLELLPVELFAAGRPLAVDRLAAPVLDQRRVVFDRGLLQEVWDLEPLGARQSFVLRERLAGGELVLRLPLGGDVLPEVGVASAGDAAGLSFRSPEGAGVRYGEVLCIDAAGRTLTEPSRLVQGAIEIRIPAEYLVVAQYPLTIDPLLSAFNVDTGSDDPTDADIAYNSFIDSSLVVFEDSFSTSDTDIVSRSFNINGNFIDEVGVDISDEETIDPAVATNEQKHQFLVAWTQTGAGLFNTRRIEARTRNGDSTSQGSELELSLGQGNESTPDVGGPALSNPSGSYYVVWSENSLLHGQNIRGRSVSSTGVLGSNLLIDTSNGDQLLPAISQEAGVGKRWCVAWQHTLSATNSAVRAATILDTGAAGTFFQDLTAELPGNDSNPDVAGDGTEFLVVFQRKQANGTSDIAGTRFSQAASGITIFKTHLLSAAEPGVVLSRHQSAPAVAYMQTGFCYAYQEAATATTSAFDVFAASTDFGLLNLAVVEGHVLLSPSSPTFDGDVSMSSLFGGNLSVLSWTRVASSGDTDVLGARYTHP